MLPCGLAHDYQNYWGTCSSLIRRRKDGAACSSSILCNLHEVNLPCPCTQILLSFCCHHSCFCLVTFLSLRSCAHAWKLLVCLPCHWDYYIASAAHHMPLPTLEEGWGRWIGFTYSVIFLQWAWKRLTVANVKALLCWLSALWCEHRSPNFDWE